MSRLFAAVTVILVAAATAAQADPAQPREDSAGGANSELEPMTVTPLGDPFEEADERVRERMERLPCLGCGPEQQESRRSPYGVIGRILTALTGFGTEPPNPSREERIEYRVANDWRVSEYGPEMEAFR